MLRVDDEEMIVESVWYKLRRLGDEVTAITDSQEALKQRSSWSAQSHLADEVQVQLAGGPPSLFPGRNFRPEFLVQGSSSPAFTTQRPRCLQALMSKTPER